MIKPTANNLKKLQTLLEEQAYVVRFEKGNFQSGYCLIENKKVAVVNKFFDLEGKVNCLLDILTNIEIDENLFTEKSQQLYKKIFKTPEKEKSDAEKLKTESEMSGKTLNLFENHSSSEEH